MMVLTSLEAERERLRMLKRRNPFGTWLIAQRRRDGWIGQLGRYAARDPRFPRAGSPREVHNRIRSQAWDDDTFGALRDAECEWNDAIRSLAKAWAAGRVSPHSFP